MRPPLAGYAAAAVEAYQTVLVALLFYGYDTGIFFA